MTEITQQNTKLAPMEELAAAMLKAEQLHSGVPYGHEKTMFDHVRRCAEIALEQTGNLKLAELALLHKSRDVRKIHGGVPLSDDTIRELGGEQLLEAVMILDTQPHSEGKDKSAAAAEKAAWARTLSPMVQQLLLIEKISNFETSRDNPNPTWTAEKHAEYYRTRMQVVEACKDADPALYALACMTRDEGMARLSAKQPAASQPAVATPQKTPEQEQKSWGEKYKSGAYNFVRNQFLNYFVNFIIAAIFAYSFDTGKAGEKFRTWRDQKSTQLKELYNVPKGLSDYVLDYLTKTQLMLCGGHVLLPILTWMKNRKQRLEFRMGHMLDSMQEFFGMGNAASKRSIAEYDHVSSLVSIGDHNRRQSDGLPVPKLSERDKELLAKHGVNEQLQFTDKKQPWGQVLMARLKGMLVTTGMGVAMGISSHMPWKALRFRETVERPVGTWLGENIIHRIPLVHKLFNKDLPLEGRTIKGRTLIGEYLFDEMIFTAGSKFGFDRAEAAYERAEKEAHARAERSTQKTTIQPSTSLKNLVESGPKDFGTRLTENSNQSMALA